MVSAGNPRGGFGGVFYGAPSTGVDSRGLKTGLKMAGADPTA